MSWLLPFLGACGLVLVAQGVVAPRRRRLEARVEPYLHGLKGRPSGLLHRSPTGLGLLGRIEVGVRRFLPYSHAELSARLESAGDVRRPEEFRLEQLLWGLAGVVTVSSGLSLAALSRIELDLKASSVLILVGGVTGYLARDWYLGRQVAARRSLITAELPIALDLIALAIMAGESVPAAFRRTAPRLGRGLGVEFERVVADIRAGSPTIEAIEALAGRVQDAGLARFVDAVCTAIERGAPLSDVLRGQADDARDARRRHLLELGGQKEVWMLVPVVFLIMPVVVVFALYPGLVSLNLLVP